LAHPVYFLKNIIFKEACVCADDILLLMTISIYHIFILTFCCVSQQVNRDWIFFKLKGWNVPPKAVVRITV